MEPYFTTYPSSAWYWFDKAVYGQFPPRGRGDLPTAQFKKLTGGEALGDSRRYASRDEAMTDLAATAGG